jgi:hypothetical protein
MIRNDEEFEVVLKQLRRAEEALAALRMDVLPKNKRNFEVFSEGYVDQIASLKADLDDYNSRRVSPSPETSAPANQIVQPS